MLERLPGELAQATGLRRVLVSRVHGDRIVPVDVYVIGCPPRPEGLFYALLKLQDKIDQMSLAKRPTEVRLHPEMVEDFKRGVMVAQTPAPR